MKRVMMIVFLLTNFICAMDVPDSLNAECVICFDMLFEIKEIDYFNSDKKKVSPKKVYIDDVIFLRCGHRFHQKCLNRHVSEKIAVREIYDNAGMVCKAKTDCPVCRDLLKSHKEYGEQEKDRLYDSVVIKPSQASSKWAALFCLCGLSVPLAE